MWILYIILLAIFTKLLFTVWENKLLLSFGNSITIQHRGGGNTL